MKKKIIIISFFFGSFLSKAQNTKISDSFYNSIYSGDWDKSFNLLKDYKESILNDQGTAKYYWYKGYLLLQKGEYVESYNSFIKSRNLCIENNLLKEQAKAESRLIECISLLNNRNESANVIDLISIDTLIDSTCEIAEILDDDDIRIHCEYNKSERAANLKNYNSALTHTNNMGKIYLKQKDTVRYIANLLNTAPFLSKLKRYQEALVELNVAEQYYEKYDSMNYRSRILVYSHKCDQYYNLNELDSALSNIKQAEKLLPNYDNTLYKDFVYDQLKDVYEKKEDYKQALLITQKLIKLRDSNQYENLLKDISDIKTKYDSAEKEKENIILKNKQQKYVFQIYALTALVIAVSLVGYLLYNNSRRKRLLIKKEKELERESHNRALKELELKSIDAMINAQEQERKFIAEDLHDDLGSSLTTIKLYVESLKTRVKKDNIKIINKTEQLINEAYESMRNMSHVRFSNHSTINGLIPAVIDLASKISSSNNIKATVTHDINNDTLGDKFELKLFRIIQELFTNAIKHADPNNIKIHIETNINSIKISFEDDGKGFDQEKTNKKNGSGIKNIKERVRVMNGQITINSNNQTGTSVNLKIPLN